MELFIIFIDIFCLVFVWAILLRAILSWFPIRPDNPLLIILHRITEPILAPLRHVIPRLGMLDIIPIVAILLWLTRYLVHTFLS